MSQYAIIQKQVPFRTQQVLGDSYHFPVKLRRSHGTTWNTDGSAFTLNSPVSPLTQNASASPVTFVLQEDISYVALSRAHGNGEAAFGDAMDDIVIGMREDAQFYLEMTLLHGGQNIGVISANSGTGTTQTVTISAATWAAGIFSQFEGGKLDLYTAAGTLINANSAVTVSTVLADSRQLILTGEATDLAVATTGVQLVPYGAQSKWFSGLDKVLTNTATLFSIDAGTYGLWKANTHTAGSAKLTMSKLQAAISKAVGRGLMEDVVAVMSPYTWTDINDDTAGLRRFAQSTKSELDLGTSGVIKFYGVNGGSVELVSHPMAKAGQALVFPPKRFLRVGSTDTTSRLVGIEGQEQNFYQELESSAGIRLRCVWDQVLMPRQPAKCVAITGIVNESGP